MEDREKRMEGILEAIYAGKSCDEIDNLIDLYYLEFNEEYSYDVELEILESMEDRYSFVEILKGNTPINLHWKDLVERYAKNMVDYTDIDSLEDGDYYKELYKLLA